MNQNATREQIVAALQAGHSVYRINKDLRADRARVRAIRDELGLGTYVPTRSTRTIEDKWRLFARPLDGGHMEWTGERGTAAGTPLLSFKDRHHSAAAIAFRIRTGRDPKGYVIADCGMKHCVAPEHVEDEADRARNREQLRYVLGGRRRKDRCIHGHDQAEHGAYGAKGAAYCRECKRLAKRAAR